MIQVNKAEAQMVRKLLGDGVSVYRTCKQKSKRHHYLMSCEPYALNAVKDFQSGVSEDELKRKYGRFKDQVRLY